MLRAALARVATPLVRRAPLGVLRHAVPRDVVVFLWHTLSDAPLPHVRHLYPVKSPEEFERDLAWVARHYRVVPYERVREARAGGRPLPPRAALLTMDDGMRECLTTARPLLLKHGLPCTFFLTGDFLDNRRLFYRHKVSLVLDAARRLAPGDLALAVAPLGGGTPAAVATPAAFEAWLRGLGADREDAIDAACERLGVDVAAFLRDRRPYLTSDEARLLAADGFAIGGHGRAHVRLGALASPADVEAEIVESCRAAMRLSGRDHAPFAFPFYGDDVDRDFLAVILARHPCVTMLFDTAGVRRDRPFVVHRVGVDAPPAPGEATTLPRELRWAYGKELAG